MNPVETISVWCPRCRQYTPSGIPLFGGAQTYIHARSGRTHCRLIVVPDPTGDDHWVELVPPDREMIDFLEALLLSSPDVRSRHRRCLARGIQAVA